MLCTHGEASDVGAVDVHTCASCTDKLWHLAGGAIPAVKRSIRPGMHGRISTGQLRQSPAVMPAVCCGRQRLSPCSLLPVKISSKGFCARLSCASPFAQATPGAAQLWGPAQQRCASARAPGGRGGRQLAGAQVVFCAGLFAAVGKPDLHASAASWQSLGGGCCMYQQGDGWSVECLTALQNGRSPC